MVDINMTPAAFLLINNTKSGGFTFVFHNVEVTQDKLFAAFSGAGSCYFVVDE